MPRIFFWFGQISTQTLNSMMVPSHAPMPMIEVVAVLRRRAEREGADEVRAPRYQAPVSQVATAAQRNQNSARGAMYLVMPAPPGPPLSAAATARPGSAPR